MSTAHPTALVAEDEQTLRQELVERLGQLWPELSVLGEAADGVQALRLAESLRPDVLFLDIEMPGASGIEVARQLAGSAHIVFVTAYDHYAIEAFEQGAIDYLLKPLVPARLFTSIGRLKQRLGCPAQAAQKAQSALEQVLQQLDAARSPTPRAYLRWINASVGATLRLITVDEVQYFQSDTKGWRLVLAEGDALIRKPLRELVEELDPQQFWQIHRSTVVNVQAVAGVQRDFRGRLQLQLKQGGSGLSVAESYAHRFRQM